MADRELMILTRHQPGDTYQRDKVRVTAIDRHGAVIFTIWEPEPFATAPRNAWPSGHPPMAIALSQHLAPRRPTIDTMTAPTKQPTTMAILRAQVRLPAVPEAPSRRPPATMHHLEYDRYTPNGWVVRWSNGNGDYGTRWYPDLEPANRAAGQFRRHGAVTEIQRNYRH